MGNPENPTRVAADAWFVGPFGTYTGSVTPRRARTEDRRIGRRAALVGGAAALVGIAGFGGYQAWSALGLGDLDRSVDLPGSGSGGGGSAGPYPQDPSAGQPVEIMLLGSDTRDPDAEGGRSDTIMQLHLPADRQNAYLISFPRDMWVQIPGHGEDKINAAYYAGGSSLLAKTLNELTGTAVDHAAVIDFAGFSELTEAVGGVTIRNPAEFSSHGYHFRQGKITLAGDKALWYVRERHALPRGDFDRAANQRRVVKALAAKITDPSTGPAQMAEVISRLSGYVSVDRGLTDRAILGLATSMKSAAEDLVTLQAPIAGTEYIGDQSVEVVDTEQMQQLGRALQQDQVHRYVRQHNSGG